MKEYRYTSPGSPGECDGDVIAPGGASPRVSTAVRQATVRRLLTAHRVERQEQLQHLLAEEGMAVTQATLSRDLKLMGVAKVPESGGYVYRFADGQLSDSGPGALATDLERGVLAAELSGNVMVIKTQSGHGNSVAEALDRLELPELAGTVAGDNTILAVVREGVAREQLLAALLARASLLHAWLA